MANSFALTWSNSPAFQVFDSVLLESALGEDILWSFTSADGSIDVTGWMLEFNAAAFPNTNPCVQVPNGSFTKGATGSFSFSTPKAKTQSLQPREYYWEILRTDSGFRKVLRYGRWKLGGSPSLFPGVTIPATIIPPIKGGTGTDLSASGPGVIIQASLGAALTSLTGDLTNTTYFLRKDLTWAPGAGGSGDWPDITNIPELVDKLGDLAKPDVNSFLGWDTILDNWVWVPDSTSAGDALLLEDGTNLLLENGDLLLLES